MGGYEWKINVQLAASQEGISSVSKVSTWKEGAMAGYKVIF
jgi:hypothetical protein